MRVIRALREFVKELIPNTAKRSIKQALFGYDGFAPSFSSAGEDMILRHLVGSERRQGFYVDVGAFHPVHASNTFFFYNLGWRGINIDARPGSMAEFRTQRPRDINLEVGVGVEPGLKSFFVVDALPSMSTFSRRFLEDLDMSKYISRDIMLEVRTLASLLAEHVPEGTAIDFMTIDVEGAASSVVSSNNWDRYRPAYVMIEDDGADPFASPVATLMQEQDYGLIGINPIIVNKVHNLLFVDLRASVTGDDGEQRR